MRIWLQVSGSCSIVLAEMEGQLRFRSMARSAAALAVSQNKNAVRTERGLPVSIKQRVELDCVDQIVSG